jgi:hypothetical protein
LKNVENGTPERELVYYTLGEETWKSTTTWPPAGSSRRVLFFAADNALSFDPPADESGRDEYIVDFDATTGTSNRWYTQRGGDDVVYPDRAVLESYETQSHRIIGVLPEGFEFPRGAEIWTPLREDVPHNGNRNVGYLFLVGRLLPGVSRAEAKAEMDVLVAATDRTHSPGRDREEVAAGERFLDFYLGSGTRPDALDARGSRGARPLDRLAERGKPVPGPHRSGGARARDTLRAGSHSREGVGARLRRRRSPRGHRIRPRGRARRPHRGRGAAPGSYEIPRLDRAGIDEFVVTFVALLSIASALVLTLFALAGILSDRGGVSAPRRARNSILVTQVAIAVVVLCGSGLAVRSFVSIATVDPGFRAERLLMMDLVAREDAYPGVEPKRAFYRQAIERLEKLPGVVSVAGVLSRPFAAGSVGWDSGFVHEGQAFEWQAVEHEGRTYQLPRYTDYNANPTTNMEVVTPGYFETMGIDLLEGRDFLTTDTEETPHVLIVGRSLAEKIWPGESAVGRGLIVPQSGWDENYRLQWSRIIGVVEDARYREMDGTRYDLYCPYGQDDHALRSLVVRAAFGDPYALVASIRAEIQALDPRVPVTRIATLEDVVWRELSTGGSTRWCSASSRFSPAS